MSNGEIDVGGQTGWLDLIADPVRLEILRSLSQVAEASAVDLAAFGRSSEPTLRRHLAALVSLGLVHKSPGEGDGITPGRPPVRFSLAMEVRNSVRAVFGITA